VLYSQCHQRAASVDSPFTLHSEDRSFVSDFQQSVGSHKRFPRGQSTANAAYGQSGKQDAVKPAREEGASAAISSREVPFWQGRTYSEAAKSMQRASMSTAEAAGSEQLSEQQKLNAGKVREERAVNKAEENGDKKEHQARRTAFKRSFASLFASPATKIIGKQLEGDVKSLAPSSVSQGHTPAYETSPTKADTNEERPASVALKTISSQTALTYAAALEKPIDNQLDDLATQRIISRTANEANEESPRIRDGKTAGRSQEREAPKTPSRAATAGTQKPGDKQPIADKAEEDHASDGVELEGGRNQNHAGQIAFEEPFASLFTPTEITADIAASIQPDGQAERIAPFVRQVRTPSPQVSLAVASMSEDGVAQEAMPIKTDLTYAEVLEEDGIGRKGAKSTESWLKFRKRRSNNVPSGEFLLPREPTLCP
jgi:hypothetical protein